MESILRATFAAVRLVLFLLMAAAAPACLGAPAGGCEAERFSNHRNYAACEDLPYLGASISWTYDVADLSLAVAFVAMPPFPGGWVAWGLNPGGQGMIGSQAFVAVPTGSGGGYGVKTFSIQTYNVSTPGPIYYGTSGLAAELGSDGRVRIFVTVVLDQGTTAMHHVWQVGPVINGLIAPHATARDNLKAKGKLVLVSGATTIPQKKKSHGIACTLSWGILFPIGIISSRYFKSISAWFYIHAVIQTTGFAVGTYGFYLGVYLGLKSKELNYCLHRNIGIAAIAIACVQVISLCRRPKATHKYRFYWNVYHMLAGYSILVLGIVNVFKGMGILHVEPAWRIGYICTLCFLCATAVVLEAIKLYKALDEWIDNRL